FYASIKRTVYLQSTTTPVGNTKFNYARFFIYYTDSNLDRILSQFLKLLKKNRCCFRQFLAFPHSHGSCPHPFQCCFYFQFTVFSRQLFLKSGILFFECLLR